ncbi:STAS domain-containing protein [Actinomadura sp. NPDC048955]|uniref:STAS domain-containing protein n=1 Tax=Actinomadura sp. NPDC048955 TaxID=3158228 RepID=UPI0033C91993
MSTESPDEPPVGPRLFVQVSREGPWLRVELRGELDLFTAPALLDQVGLLIGQRSSPRIALQMSQVGFCDSAGLNALAGMFQRVSAAGGDLVLLRPHPRVAQVLAITALDRFLPVYDALPPDPG